MNKVVWIDEVIILYIPACKNCDSQIFVYFSIISYTEEMKEETNGGTERKKGMKRWKERMHD